MPFSGLLGHKHMWHIHTYTYTLSYTYAHVLTYLYACIYTQTHTIYTDTLNKMKFPRFSFQNEIWHFQTMCTGLSMEAIIASAFFPGPDSSFHNHHWYSNLLPSRLVNSTTWRLETKVQDSRQNGRVAWTREGKRMQGSMWLWHGCLVREDRERQIKAGEERTLGSSVQQRGVSPRSLHARSFCTTHSWVLWPLPRKQTGLSAVEDGLSTLTAAQCNQPCNRGDWEMAARSVMARPPGVRGLPAAMHIQRDPCSWLLGTESNSAQCLVVAIADLKGRVQKLPELLLHTALATDASCVSQVFIHPQFWVFVNKILLPAFDSLFDAFWNWKIKKNQTTSKSK